MTEANPPRRVTFLFDVDNTLIDNDRAKGDLSARIGALLGETGERRFWELYEEVRRERGLVNIPLILAYYQKELATDPSLDDAERRRLRFALADVNASVPLLDDTSREFAVVEFASLGEAARHYLDQIGVQATQGVFAVAGRVDGDEARITNHPWVISRTRTASMLGFSTLHLINDFAAQANQQDALVHFAIDTAHANLFEVPHGKRPRCFEPLLQSRRVFVTARARCDGAAGSRRCRP